MSRLRVGVAGPVGSGKTALVEALCRRMDLRVHHLHGGVSVRKRPLMIQTFTEEDGPAVFISTDAGGVGLNLQAADVPPVYLKVTGAPASILLASR